MPRIADVIFFDGECGLCHGAVRFILRHDREGRFRFAPLQGRTFIEGISETERGRLPDSLVVAQDDQRLLVRSDGVVYVLEQLGGCWWALGRMLAWLPRPFRDGLYDAIAERRARLFPRPGRECPVVEAELRRRFDP